MVRRAALFALPGGSALFEEGGDAFGFVGGAAEVTEADGFAHEGEVEGEIEPFVDGAEGVSECEGCVGGDLKGEGFSAGHEFGSREELIDEADAEGFLSGDDFAGEQEAQGGAASGEAGQALGAAVAGQQAELDFGLTEVCGVCGEAEGAGHGEFTSAAEGESVDASEDGLAAGFKVAEDGLAAECEGLAFGGVEVGDLADVSAGGKGLVARAGEEDDADGGVVNEVVHGEVDFGEEFRVEGVEDFGAVEGQECEWRAEIEEDVVIKHSGSRVADGGWGGLCNRDRKIG